MPLKRKICIAISILLTVSLYAQQPITLFEIGGRYFNTKSTLSSNLATTKQTDANPSVFGKIGFFHSAKAIIGASYLFPKDKEVGSSVAMTNIYTSNVLFNERTKRHAFGLFYRYYLKPYTASKWNVFVEANPNYEKSKYRAFQRTEHRFLGYDPIVENENYSETEMWGEAKWLALDLNAGLSYRIVRSLSIQLTLSSIADAHFEIGQSDNKQALFNIFHKPLQNTFLSFTYTL